jgi:hypothetical protein
MTFSGITSGYTMGSTYSDALQIQSCTASSSPISESLKGQNADVVMQLGMVPPSNCFRRNVLYQMDPVHRDSFELSFELLINGLSAVGDGGDMFSVFFGFPNSLDNMPVSQSKNGYKIVFGLYQGVPSYVSKGVFLYDSNGRVVQNTSLPVFDNTYKQVVIKYNKGAVNTWKVIYNDVTLLSYNDANNTAWLQSNKNNYWGFYAASGPKNHTSFIRKINMNKIFPYVSATGNITYNHHHDHIYNYH